MNRLELLFQQKNKNILNIYFTAGYPQLQDTETIILNLEQAGADVIELGMPYSDPLADGPVIQQSGQVALANGMTLPLLFEQVTSVRTKTEIPLVLMGYFNQVMQYGEEQFIAKCKSVGIDGVILPDMPVSVYEAEYKDLFEQYDLPVIFLITPQTSAARIQKIDELSRGFVYIVSDASITGANSGINQGQIAYFEKLNHYNLKNPYLIGFGISNRESFQTVCQYANGAIIGSAFIRALGNSETDVATTTQAFVKDILA
jgi:tryptophan synthase alpha chain